MKYLTGFILLLLMQNVFAAHCQVDGGPWVDMKTSPLDVHVERVAKSLGLLKRKQTDWQAALELTENLRLFDEKDPVKYDFALFGAGVMEKWHDI